MSQQSVRQAARRSALDAQAILRKERADRERRLEALAVTVLSALGERDALVRDAERRAGQALQTMTNDEGPLLREAAEWCGRGLTVREITGPTPPGDGCPAASPDERATRGREQHGKRSTPPPVPKWCDQCQPRHHCGASRPRARHNTSLRKTLSRSEWNRRRGSARPPLNTLQGTDSIRRRTSHEGELAETAVPPSTSKMRRRSSGPSLTDGSVARSAQPVLRPPPTPVTSPYRCSSTTRVRPAAVLTVLFGRCSSSPQPGQVDRLNAENFVVANVAAAVLTSITKRGSRHYCW
jgi:hypothetical protein